MNNMHLCGSQKNDGFLRYRDIANEDESIYIYKYNIMKKEYTKKLAKTKCQCKIDSTQFENKFIDNLNEDFSKNTDFDYNDFLIKLEEENINTDMKLN